METEKKNVFYGILENGMIIKTNQEVGTLIDTSYGFQKICAILNEDTKEAMVDIISTQKN